MMSKRLKSFLPLQSKSTHGRVGDHSKAAQLLAGSSGLVGKPPYRVYRLLQCSRMPDIDSGLCLLDLDFKFVPA